MDFLTTKRFYEFKSNKLALMLKDLGVEHHFFNIKGKGVNCYSLPLGLSLQTAPFTVPAQEQPTPI
jgi:hypothetical protein